MAVRTETVMLVGGLVAMLLMFLGFVKPRFTTMNSSVERLVKGVPSSFRVQLVAGIAAAITAFAKAFEVELDADTILRLVEILGGTLVLSDAIRPIGVTNDPEVKAAMAAPVKVVKVESVQ